MNRPRVPSMELLRGFAVEEARLDEELLRTLETLVQERMVVPRDG